MTRADDDDAGMAGIGGGTNRRLRGWGYLPLVGEVAP